MYEGFQKVETLCDVGKNSPTNKTVQPLHAQQDNPETMLRVAVLMSFLDIFLEQFENIFTNMIKRQILSGVCFQKRVPRVALLRLLRF